MDELPREGRGLFHLEMGRRLIDYRQNGFETVISC